MSQFLTQYGPFVLGIGLCLVMHLFMHKGHGNKEGHCHNPNKKGYNGNDEQSSKQPVGENK